MDELDRRIVTEMQMDFPVEADPYAIVAGRLGIDVDTLLERVRGLLESGVIRRVGVSVDSRKMGFTSTLAAVRVGDDRVNAASEVIETYREITHSYLRADEYNIWFTVIAESVERIAEVLEEIKIKLGIGADDVLNLPVKRFFKLDARFKPKKD